MLSFCYEKKKVNIGIFQETVEFVGDQIRKNLWKSISMENKWIYNILYMYI